MASHQHFIPRSYLKNFAVETTKHTFLVEAKHRSEESPKANLLSIADLCVKRNIYTIPTDDVTRRYALEDFYARNVDGVYPEVYAWLTDPSLTRLSVERKVKILMTIMSMYFRTPRFLSFHEGRFEQALQLASTAQRNNKGNIQFTFEGRVFDFALADIDNVRRTYQLENKKKFLHSHLQAWHDFTQIKLDANISVSKIYQDVELITSDNPVVVRRFKGKFSTIFDPENIIEVPLDSQHYLTIYPNSEKIGAGDFVGRSTWDKLHAVKVNYGIDEYSVDWLLGKPGTVHKHIADQKRYGAHSPENYAMLNDVLEMEKDMKEVLRLVQLGINQNFANLVKQLKGKSHWRDTPQLQELLDTCSHHNLSVD